MVRRPPLLSLRDARITFGGPALFEGVSLGIGRGDRLCLVGRNGCGKSTLMKALSGEVGLDRGDRFAAPGMRVGSSTTNSYGCEVIIPTKSQTVAQNALTSVTDHACRSS